jgi:hypothetical protein
MLYINSPLRKHSSKRKLRRCELESMLTQAISNFYLYNFLR